MGSAVYFIIRMRMCMASDPKIDCAGMFFQVFFKRLGFRFVIKKIKVRSAFRPPIFIIAMIFYFIFAVFILFESFSGT